MNVYSVEFYYKDGSMRIIRLASVSRLAALRKIDRMIEDKDEKIIFGFVRWMIPHFDENENVCVPESDLDDLLDAMDKHREVYQSYE